MRRFGPSVVGSPWGVAGRETPRSGFQIRIVKGKRWADDLGVDIRGNCKIR